ncbi:MAG: ABC transporter permease [Chloroflexi bacterium]|nr:ABC transporter permease [Chloroflexota bacterium]
MTAFAYHLAYDFRTGLRDKSLMLMNYLFPLGFYLMVGLLMTGINPVFRETMIPAIILVAMMAGTVLGLPNPVVAARAAGIYRSYKINGIPALSIVTIPVLGTVAHMVLVSAIITLTAEPIFHAVLPVNWGAFVLVGILAAFSLAATGMLIGVVASNERATVLLGQLIFLPAMMLGGLMVPANLLPAGLYRFSLLLPPSQAMNAFRGLAYGAASSVDPILSVLALVAGGLLSFGLAIYLFEWDSSSKRRRSPFLALLALLPYALSALLLA